MIKSAEVRWFLSSVPDEITTFFNVEASSRFSFEEERIDYYLDMDAYPNLSYKLRSGKLEIKTLSENLGVYNFGPSVSGNVEKWIKWSSLLKSDLKTTNQVFDSGVSFFEMKKQRVMIKFALQDNGLLRKADKEESDLAAGCQVELTKIELSDRSLYSLGLESFGDDDLLVSTLLTTANKVFSEIKSTLSKKDSYSYPSLLSKMKAR
jgi:hypothetical protein